MLDSRARRAFATEVVGRLRDAGHRALWAGGCVRDLLLGLEPADYDVATDASPQRVMTLFRRTVPVGVSFGVVRVLGPRGAGEVEVATFRSDGAYLDGRRPESVTFGTPEEDASRRDFTINGMFLDPLSGQVLDFVGGQEDLKAGVLRAIGDPAARFAEDKLRLLRAVRFAARFDLRIEPRTRASLERMADQVRVVAAERIAQELRKLLVHPSRVRGMRLVAETGLLGAILPDLAPLRGLPLDPADPARSDAWEGTLRVLAHLPGEPTVTLALAALLHAVGLPAGQGGCPENPQQTPDPARTGAERADAIARDLRLSNDERERIAWLIAHQAALNQAERLPRSRLKRLLASPGIGDLLALHRALALAADGDASHVDFCERYLREQPDGPIDPPPLLSGDDLKRHGLRPGPRFKILLDQVRDAQLEGHIQDRDEALRWVDALLAADGAAQA